MLTPDQVDDFVTLTLSLFKRRAWTDLSLEYVEYVFARIIREKSVTERGGKDISFRLKVKNTGNFRNTGLYATDVAKVEDVMIEASVPWTKQTTNWSYDIDEDLFQSDPETIISELQIREHDAMSDYAEGQEENLWSAPTNPQDKRPMGIPFWFQKNTSVPEGDYTGGNPAGFTAGRANVDSTLYPRWRNWAGGYSRVNRDDLVRKVKRALAFTHFIPAVPHPELGFGEAKCTMYTTYRVQEPLERLAETRNDNLGSDLAKYINQVTIGGCPMTWVPYLNANDTSDPIYGINWSTMRPFVKRGCNMRRSKPMPAPGHTQHTVRTVHIDNWMNYICYDLRKNWVLSRI